MMIKIKLSESKIEADMQIIIVLKGFWHQLIAIIKTDWTNWCHQSNAGAGSKFHIICTDLIYLSPNLTTIEKQLANK